MDDENTRKVRGAIFYRAEERIIGTRLQIEQSGEIIQTLALADIEDYRRKKDGRKTMLFVWETECTECGAAMRFKARNMTKDLKRRCKLCNEETPYDPVGWSTRPRNTYWRTTPDDGEQWVSPTHGESLMTTRPFSKEPERWPLLYGLKSEDRIDLGSAVRRDLGSGASTEAVRDEAERRLREKDEIDPASLF